MAVKHVEARLRLKATSLDAPNLDDVISAAGGDPLSIRAESDAVNLFFMPAQSEDFPSSLDIPKFHVERSQFSKRSDSRDEAFTVGAERHAINTTGKPAC